MQILEQWAGHFLGGTSDKVWAAAVTDEGDYLYTYGRRFTRLTTKKKAFGSVNAARAWYCQEVMKKNNREGYHSIPFDSDDYKVPSFGPLATATPPARSGRLTQTPPPPPSPTRAVAMPFAPTPTSPIPLCPLMPIAADDLDEFLDDTSYGIIEYPIGVRAIVMSDGINLAAYYPDSSLASSVQEAAQVLTRLNVPIVLDGIQLGGGQYIVIDLLAWNGANMGTRSYRERIGIVSRAFQQAGLIMAALPVRPKQMPGSARKQLGLLVARTTDKRQVIESLRRSGAAGVLLRLMDEPGFLPVRQHTFRFEPEAHA